MVEMGEKEGGVVHWAEDNGKWMENVWEMLNEGIGANVARLMPSAFN